MLLQVELSGDYAAALAAVPARLHQALSSKAALLALELQARVQQKLAGGVLEARSGALARSIVGTIDASSADVAVSVSASADVKYAAIHEFGGAIPPHQIVPDKARALAFAVAGKQVFAARTNLPAITIPERSYMRSSLADMADEIRQGLAEAVAQALG